MITASADLIQKHLACTRCKGSLVPQDSRYACTACHREFGVRDGVFMARAPGEGHYFDNRHHDMEEGNESPEIQELCYLQQSRLAADLIQPDDVIVDIGCGPSLHYEKARGAVIIGVDASFESIHSNKDLDIRVFGGADAIPLPNKSADRIFLFYSIHHMVGKTTVENTANLQAVLQECSRVVRSNGHIVAFDMSPWWVAWQAQNLAWNWARKVLADKLDMFFWRHNALQKLAREAFAEATLQTRTFHVSPFLVFPPVFSLPNLKIPRFLFPFDVNMYKWSF